MSTWKQRCACVCVTLCARAFSYASHMKEADMGSSSLGGRTLKWATLTELPLETSRTVVIPQIRCSTFSVDQRGDGNSLEKCFKDNIK